MFNSFCCLFLFYSSLGSNLDTSPFIGEVLFAVFISIFGLILFSLLVGNMQVSTEFIFCIFTVSSLYVIIWDNEIFTWYRMCIYLFLCSSSFCLSQFTSSHESCQLNLSYSWIGWVLLRSLVHVSCTATEISAKSAIHSC